MRYLFFLWGIGVYMLMQGQTIRILGHVRDSLTGDPIPFANVMLKGTNVGAITDFDGDFRIETSVNADTLVVSYLGYKKKLVPIKMQFQEITIYLVPTDYMLKEVVILPGENPAIPILKKVLANKKRNSFERIRFYEVEVYNKLEVDINNINNEKKSPRLLKPFEWVLDYADTSLENGTVYLPLFISESVSKLYYRYFPRSKREFIEAVKISGIENQSVSQFLGNMYQEINIYDNFITILDKNFVSPIADVAQLYYKYYLVDSMYVDSIWCYKIMFKPRREQELTFSGTFWVATPSYAIKKVEMKISSEANINFINALFIQQHFTAIQDSSVWVPTREQVIVDFNLFQNNQKIISGFFARKNTYYRNYVIGQPREDEFYLNPNKVIFLPDFMEKSSEYWDKIRPDTLSAREKQIYSMVDSLKKHPVFKFYYNLVQTFSSGFYPLLYVEIGPYASLVSFNAIEGTRMRVGGRTSPNFSKKLRLWAYSAYGTKDKDFKYAGGFLYVFKKNPRRTLSFNYKHDYEQLGISPSGFREDFILATLFTRQSLSKLTMVNQWRLQNEYEWFPGFMTTFRFVNREIFSLDNQPFSFLEGTQENLTNSEITFVLRLAYKEKFLYNDFNRMSMGSTFPIIQFQYSRGVKDLFHGDFSYHKLQFSWNDWFNVGNLGWSKYIIEAGKIFGRLPYPFLFIHPGNETYFLDETAFNMMNYFEFISDSWISFYYIHRFDGLFLNYFPLLKKLKWRELIWVKGLAGTMSQKNLSFSSFPTYTYTLSKPYFEAGIGIENIFKFFRIDGVWRFSYLDHPRVSRFQPFFTVQAFF
ncbi:MAG: DUF5686 and carboxypeptidase regulatory-like domain-containing protein [Bacteroidales bacterium]|nr:DUF5686 and carboxypeptidase regulatory-like domain-containing protein [Bacteroidales bacterium]